MIGVLAGIKTVLGGGKGEAITKIMDAADNIFTSKEEKIKLQNDLIEAQNRHDEAKEAIILQTLQAEFAEMSNARAREIAVASDEHTPMLNKLVTPILALGIVILIFTFFLILMFTKHTQVEKDIILYILGVLSAALTQIMSYYFGSSSGSHNKQKQLNKMQNKEVLSISSKE